MKVCKMVFWCEQRFEWLVRLKSMHEYQLMYHYSLYQSAEVFWDLAHK